MYCKTIEIWSDSFHEGDWCCRNLSDVFKKEGCVVTEKIINGYIPEFSFKFKSENILKCIVYGTYNSWVDIPEKITELLDWGKPDFIAYDPDEDKILFAVEETAATSTGNQTVQRCERQYGAARARIPYWFLTSEFSEHKDGGTRRDSIWSVVAALKLSLHFKTISIVNHYSDSTHSEDYHMGEGLSNLFSSLSKLLENHVEMRDLYSNLNELIESQYHDMLHFLLDQWMNIVDYLPSIDVINHDDTAEIITNAALNLPNPKINQLNNFLHWPLISELPESLHTDEYATDLLKFDKLCNNMENDVKHKRAYTLSKNAGSGKPPSSEALYGYIAEQKMHYNNKLLSPPADFSINIDDFPYTDTTLKKNRHITTAKNIVYLYDKWADIKKSIISAYPRLEDNLPIYDNNTPVFVYVSNSVKFGRIFGDPFTGQLASYSIAFGKYDNEKRLIMAYFPHQVYNQVFNPKGELISNKGITLMSEITDLILFHPGVVITLNNKKVY